jgi:hypothetical protein
LALKAAIIMTGVAIALLVIYGADVAVSKSSDGGFLPFDHKVRGMGLGGPALILPIIGFFISRKESSKTLAAMLIVAGVLILIGGAAVLSMPSPEGATSETIPLFAVGAFQIALGIIKFRK